MLFSVDRILVTAAGETAAEHADSPRQERQGATRVRHDDTEFRTARRCPAENQVDDRARAIEGELDHWARISERTLLPAYRRGGMNEDHRAPPIELIEHRVQPFVAEVPPIEVGQTNHSVELGLARRIAS